MPQESHTIEKIAPDAYRIDEMGCVNCYLLVGSDRSLLVDTGLGIGNLRDVVSDLCDTPVDVVLTHAHADHDGGVGWFDSFYVHEADRAGVHGLMSSRTVASLMIPRGADVPQKPCHPNAIAIRDGHAFDLGDRSVVARSVPGHTRGSIALVDDRRHLMITGDAINPSLWMQLPGCTTLAEWLPAGRTLLELARTHEAWCGHGPGRQDAEQLRQTYDMVEMLSHERNSTLPHVQTWPDRRTFPQVVFNTARRS